MFHTYLKIGMIAYMQFHYDFHIATVLSGHDSSETFILLWKNKEKSVILPDDSLYDTYTAIQRTHRYT